MDKWLTPSLVVALLAFGLSALNSYYARKQDAKKLFEEMDDRLSEVEADLKVLKKQIELFWGTVERQMAKKFRDGE